MVRVQLGFGRPGKLWTGSREFFPNCEVVGLDGQYAEVELIENWSENGQTTRRLFGHKAELTQEQVNALWIPVLFISAGGARTVGEGAEGTRTWNWSGRVGGNVVLDPLMVHQTTRRVIEHDPLPEARPGYRWVQTYLGDSLLEYVLVELCDEKGTIDPRHLLPCCRWHRATLSPTEKGTTTETSSEIERMLESEEAGPSTRIEEAFEEVEREFPEPKERVLGEGEEFEGFPEPKKSVLGP